MKIQVQIEFNRPHLRVHRRFVLFEAVVLALILALTGALSRTRAESGTCSGQAITLPFNDVMGNGFFCFIAEVYFLGITAGCGDGTAYCPDSNVTRGQMAVFLDRAHDSALRRGSRRAALNQWWTPQVVDTNGEIVLVGFGVSSGPEADVVCNGDELVVVAEGGVFLVRASHGTITNAANKFSDSNNTPVGKLRTAVVADRRIYVAGGSALGRFRPLDHSEAIGGANLEVFLVSNNFSPDLQALTFDGSYIWTGSSSGVIGKVALVDDAVTTVGNTYGNIKGMLFDGANVWAAADLTRVIVGQVTTNPTIRRLDFNGTVLTEVITGSSTGSPVGRPIFDGANIWVPNGGDNTVTVIRATTGAVLAQLSGNGLNGPAAAAFDGQRVAVTNSKSNTVSLWKAADLTPLGSFVVHNSFHPFGICSDGVNFWITVPGIGVVRF